MESIVEDLSSVNFDENLKDGEEYKKVATFGASDDPRMQYDLVDKTSIQNIDPTQEYLIQEDKMDYLVPRTEEAI